MPSTLPASHSAIFDEPSANLPMWILPPPDLFISRIQASSRALASVPKQREAIASALRGHGFVVICGPCSIHHVGAALEYADRLARLKESLPSEWTILMRCFFEKSRSGLGWKGLLHGGEARTHVQDGICQTRTLLAEVLERGLGTAAELLSPWAVPYVQDLLSWGGIGARSSQSQVHRELAGGLSLPVGFKNCLSGEVEAALRSVQVASRPQSVVSGLSDGRLGARTSPGNQDAHLVLRGGRSGSNVCSRVLEQVEAFARANDLVERVLVDCSHGNSGRCPQNQWAIAKAALELQPLVVGILVESYLQGGSQKDLGDQSAPDCSITDPCLSWEETVSFLQNAADLYSSGSIQRNQS
jgi:3-deoxy-7-phosphoheptulonate synthase